MKKVIVTIIAVLFCAVSMAQNLQVHYDFGKNLYSNAQADRASVTLTFEQFAPDKLGSWFYFIDLDIKDKGMSGAYTEISREFTLIKKLPFAAHIEYNGGINLAGSFQNAALAGIVYNGNTKDYSKTWSAQILYKQYFGNGRNKPISCVQFTGVWGMNLLQNKLTFSGFVDIWNGYIPEWDAQGQKRGWILLAEPQLWYNWNKRFSIGTEVEISNNFIYRTNNNTNTFFINPTLAIKYNF